MTVPPARTGRQPRLRERPAREATRAVVLVLYGGRAESTAPSRPWHLSALRMASFARAVRRWGARRSVTVVTLRYRMRGWNGPDESPVADARWALAEIRARRPDAPVLLLGHSMGGRTAFRVADDPAVAGIVGLAPWLPRDEPRTDLAGKDVLVVHGTADRWTDPVASREYVTAARTAGARATWVPIDGVGHFMLRRRRRWRRLVIDFVADHLGDPPGEPPDGPGPGSGKQSVARPAPNSARHHAG